MPSLINQPFRLEFGPAWPMSLELPPLKLNRRGSFGEGVKRGKNSSVTACPHTNKKPFAKSMCHKCY